MSEHTPTPWTADGCDILARDGQDIVADTGCLNGLDIYASKANAEFIVRAANAHEELVEALKYYLHLIGVRDKWILGTHVFGDEKWCARCEFLSDLHIADQKAIAALARVEAH